MAYAQIDLTGPTVVAHGMNLPAWLAPLGASFEQVTDCGWAGHDGVGYWEEVVSEPSFDPAAEMLTGAIVWEEPDVVTKTVSGTPEVRALTAEEIAERTPRPLVLSKMQFIRLVQTAGGMTDALLVQADAEPLLKPFWVKFAMTTEMQRDDMDTQAGLGALEALGLLPNGAQAILDAWPH